MNLAFDLRFIETAAAAVRESLGTLDPGTQDYRDVAAALDYLQRAKAKLVNIQRRQP